MTGAQELRAPDARPARNPGIPTVRQLALHSGLALAAGAAVGLAVRGLADDPSPPECAAAAMTVVLAAAVAGAACTGTRDGECAARLAIAARIAVLAWGSSAAAGIAAGGGAGAPEGAVVAAAAAVLAFGLRAILGTLRASVPAASFSAAALALAPAALLFVADPWIDWRGGSPASPGRARIVLTANPLAAMTSPSGGLCVDFQRMPMLYDGPSPGVPGLSLIGQYYPAIPPSPFGWGAPVLGIGAALVAAARRRG